MRHRLTLFLLATTLTAAGCAAAGGEVLDGDLAAQTEAAATLPKASDQPIPVEPDGGIGDGAEPLPSQPEPSVDDAGESGNPGGARAVEPHDDVIDPQPIRWDTVSVDDDAGALTVRWWSGVEPCTVLDRVEVDYGPDSVTVTVWEGAPPNAATITCIALAEHKQYSVVLDEAVGDREIVDGATT